MSGAVFHARALEQADERDKIMGKNSVRSTGARVNHSDRPSSICEGLSHISTRKNQTRPDELCFPIFGRFYEVPPAASLPPLVDDTFIYNRT